MPAGEIFRHGFPQWQDALRRRVAVMTVAQRLDGCLDDVLRRLEVRLANAEVDDVLALALQLRCARQHLESRLRSQPFQVVDKLHDVSPVSVSLAGVGKALVAQRLSPGRSQSRKGSPIADLGRPARAAGELRKACPRMHARDALVFPWR
jgi:hypothetical protein